MEETLKELLQFLRPEQRLDIKTVALTHVLGLTVSAEGQSSILSYSDIIDAIYILTMDETKNIAKNAVLCLINLTANEAGAKKVYETVKHLQPKLAIVELAFQHIIDENSELADPWAMVLSNLTRIEEHLCETLDLLEKNAKILKLAKAFSNLDYNKKGEKLHFLAQIFCNLTQCSRGRELFCKSKYRLLENFIPFSSYEKSIVRRSGVIGIIKNICFDPVYHDMIIGENDQLLHCLLYPLAGPEEFDDEENDKLLITLQYLGEDKARETDPDLRKMILESFLQLCATKKYREFLRTKGTYEILREYHKWEATIGNDKNALMACENVVDILIKKEDEIGVDNIKELEVPNDLQKKFIENDEIYSKE